LAFLDRETEHLTGARLAGPVVDTVGLARRLLAGRTPRAGLASLAQFFGTDAQPCHRALPDAQATAEIRLRLAGRAPDRRAPPVRTATSISVAAATASSALLSRRRSARSRAVPVRVSPHELCAPKSSTGRSSLCAASAPGCASSPTAGASRTRRVCATVSRPSRT